MWQWKVCLRLKGRTNGKKANDQETSSNQNACFLIVAWLLLSSTLTIEAVCSSETSINFYRTRRRHVLRNNIVYIHVCVNLISICDSLVAIPTELTRLPGLDALESKKKNPTLARVRSQISRPSSSFPVSTLTKLIVIINTRLTYSDTFHLRETRVRN
jgi:hypothetical protein